MEALDKGLAYSSFTSFYYLSRSILVKSETDFDKFDGAFLEYFKDVKTYEELPQELLDWLNNPKEKKNNYDKAQDEKNLALSLQEIQKMLLERLRSRIASITAEVTGSVQAVCLFSATTEMPPTV